MELGKVVKGAGDLKTLSLQSNEFKRVLQNLDLENLNLTLEKQKKVLSIVNSRAKITPGLIKELMGHDKI